VVAVGVVDVDAGGDVDARGDVDGPGVVDAPPLAGEEEEVEPAGEAEVADDVVADAVSAVFVLPPEVITAAPTAASINTTVTAITPRSPALVGGKSGLRIPSPSDTTSAQTTSAAPAI
jgi:hypothetical protein